VRPLARLLRLPLRLLPPERFVPILSGPLRGWRWVIGSATHGAWLGTYEREVQRLFQQSLRPGDVCFDVGANVGFYTLLASRLVGERGTVVAFEPLPRNLGYLRRHLEANRIRNVRLLPVAVSDRGGTAHFAEGNGPAMGSLAESGGLEVQTVTLDQLVASGELPAPSFVKIDVEGAEDAVLTGAAGLLRAHHPTILLSTHGYRHHQTCWSRLKEFGYVLSLLRDGTADGNYVLVAEARQQSTP
jgi:FkbM family methyltransferase